MPIPLKCSRSTDATIVSFAQPNFVMEGVVDEIQDALDAILRNEGERSLVLDLTEVRFVSSRFLSLLVKLSGVRRGGNKIALVGLQEHLKEPFRITRLDRRFDFFADVKTAIKTIENVPTVEAAE